MKILLFDNYDSFTYNLRDLLYKVRPEATIEVMRNTDERVLSAQFDLLVVSPGPKTPRDTGLLDELMKNKVVPQRIPFFGVCLGMQYLADFSGAGIVVAKDAKHGRTATVVHNDKDVFEGVKQGFRATRYNSLEVKLCGNEPLEMLAYEEETGMIMALRHRELPFFAVQFHPESFLSECSLKYLDNFFKQYVENN